MKNKFSLDSDTIKEINKINEFLGLKDIPEHFFINRVWNIDKNKIMSFTKISEGYEE